VANDSFGDAQVAEIRLLLAGTSDAFNHRAVFTIEVGLKHGMNVVGAAMLQATFQFSAGQT